MFGDVRRVDGFGDVKRHLACNNAYGTAAGQGFKFEQHIEHGSGIPSDHQPKALIAPPRLPYSQCHQSRQRPPALLTRGLPPLKFEKLKIKIR